LFFGILQNRAKVHLPTLLEIMRRYDEKILKAGGSRQRGEGDGGGISECFPDGISPGVQVNQQAAVFAAGKHCQPNGYGDGKAIQPGGGQKDCQRRFACCLQYLKQMCFAVGG